MASVIKTCKVCGKQYEYCHTLRPSGLFRWQDVACSPECGAEYFKQIAISRGELPAEAADEEKAQPVTEDTQNKKKATRQRKKKSEVTD